MKTILNNRLLSCLHGGKKVFIRNKSTNKLEWYLEDGHLYEMDLYDTKWLYDCKVTHFDLETIYFDDGEEFDFEDITVRDEDHI